MKIRTVAQIITRARQYIDAETPDGTVDLETDDELLVYLNEAYAELVDEVLANNGLDLLLTYTTLLPSTIPPYSLEDFPVYRSVAAEVPNGDLWTELPRFMFRERNGYRSVLYPAWRWISGLIKFFPENAAPAAVRFWFVPDATTFIESDSVPVWNGWDTYLSARIAMKMLIKEERHSSELEDEFKMARQRVQNACSDLDLGSAEQVVDTMRVAEETYDDTVLEFLPR